MKKFLEDNKITDLLHSPYSPDLAPCDYFLTGRKYSHRYSVGSAVFQYINGIPLNDYQKNFEMFTYKRLKLYITFEGEYLEGVI